MKTLLLGVLLLCAAAPVAQAQYLGTLRVQLRDADGGPLAAELRMPALRRAVLSDSATGRVIVAGVPPGTYDVEVIAGDSTLERLRVDIAPLRVTDLGEIRPGRGGDRCSYRGMYREPWSMTRITPFGEHDAAGVFEVEMGCGAPEHSR